MAEICWWLVTCRRSACEASRAPELCRCKWCASTSVPRIPVVRNSARSPKHLVARTEASNLHKGAESEKGPFLRQIKNVAVLTGFQDKRSQICPFTQRAHVRARFLRPKRLPNHIARRHISIEADHAVDSQAAIRKSRFLRPRSMRPVRTRPVPRNAH